MFGDHSLNSFEVVQLFSQGGLKPFLPWSEELYRVKVDPLVKLKRIIHLDSFGCSAAESYYFEYGSSY